MSEVRIAEPEERPFYTVQSLARRLDVTDRTIRNWIRDGLIQSYKIGDARRIDPVDVDSFLAAHRDERKAA